jgi:hypothetical protein
MEAPESITRGNELARVSLVAYVALPDHSERLQMDKLQSYVFPSGRGWLDKALSECHLESARFNTK